MGKSPPPVNALEPIQMLWVRGALSRFELLSLRSFLAHGHPVHLYTYDAPADVPAGVELRAAADIVPRERAPLADHEPFAKGSSGSFSDYFRYRLLLTRGGWWSDLDVVCLQPWRFPQTALSASTEESGHGRIANGFAMRFPPGHPVMAACAAALEPLDLRTLGIDQTGPLLLHSILQRLGNTDLPVAPAVFAPVPWNATFQLVRPLWQRFTIDELKQRLRRPHLSTRFSRATVAVHLWNEIWRYEARDKHGRHPRSCLYERLQRRYHPSTP